MTDKLQFTTEADRRTAAVEVALFVGDAKQNVIGEQRRRVDVRRQQDDLQSRPVSYTGDVLVTGVPKYVKVIVYDYEGDRAGVVVLNVARTPN